MKQPLNIINEKSKFFQCDCGTEGLMIETMIDKIDSDESGKIKFIREFCVSLFVFGNQGNKYSFFEKLRFIWTLFKTGSPYTDQIVLSVAKMLELRDFINETVKEIEN